MCTQKLTKGQLNPSNVTKKQKSKRRTKENPKNHKHEMLRRNGPVNKSVESGPEAGKESMVGKTCERGRCGAGSERERELLAVRVDRSRRHRRSRNRNRKRNRQLRDRGWDEADRENKGVDLDLLAQPM